MARTQSPGAYDRAQKAKAARTVRQAIDAATSGDCVVGVLGVVDATHTSELASINAETHKSVKAVDERIASRSQ